MKAHLLLAIALLLSLSTYGQKRKNYFDVGIGGSWNVTSYDTPDKGMAYWGHDRTFTYWNLRYTRFVKEHIGYHIGMSINESSDESSHRLTKAIQLPESYHFLPIYNTLGYRVAMSYYAGISWRYLYRKMTIRPSFGIGYTVNVMDDYSYYLKKEGSNEMQMISQTSPSSAMDHECLTFHPGVLVSYNLRPKFYIYMELSSTWSPKKISEIHERTNVNTGDIISSSVYKSKTGCFLNLSIGIGWHN